MFDKAEQVHEFFSEIAEVIERFTQGIKKETQTSSVSVNRNVRHLEPDVFLHSECSHTMISVDDYRKFLMRYDKKWSQMYRAFGIHFCGKDPDRYGEAFGELDGLDFLDVGWGGDVAKLRRYLPNTFLNIRLSPVDMIEQSTGEIEETIRQLVKESGDLGLTGVCCINIDEKVSDEKITCMFETVTELRKESEPFGKS
jgi:hypothetical protein